MVMSRPARLARIAATGAVLSLAAPLPVAATPDAVRNLTAEQGAAAVMGLSILAKNSPEYAFSFDRTVNPFLGEQEPSGGAFFGGRANIQLGTDIEALDDVDLDDVYAFESFEDSFAVPGDSLLITVEAPKGFVNNSFLDVAVVVQQPGLPVAGADPNLELDPNEGFNLRASFSLTDGAPTNTYEQFTGEEWQQFQSSFDGWVAETDETVVVGLHGPRRFVAGAQNIEVHVSGFPLESTDEQDIFIHVSENVVQENPLSLTQVDIEELIPDIGLMFGRAESSDDTDVGAPGSDATGVDDGVEQSGDQAAGADVTTQQAGGETAASDDTTQQPGDQTTQTDDTNQQTSDQTTDSGDTTQQAGGTSAESDDAVGTEQTVEQSTDAAGVDGEEEPGGRGGSSALPILIVLVIAFGVVAVILWLLFLRPRQSNHRKSEAEQASEHHELLTPFGVSLENTDHWQLDDAFSRSVLNTALARGARPDQDGWVQVTSDDVYNSQFDVGEFKFDTKGQGNRVARSGELRSDDKKFEPGVWDVFIHETTFEIRKTEAPDPDEVDPADFEPTPTPEPAHPTDPDRIPELGEVISTDDTEPRVN